MLGGLEMDQLAKIKVIGLGGGGGNAWRQYDNNILKYWLYGTWYDGRSVWWFWR